MNINIRDGVYTAIEEFNLMIVKHKRLNLLSDKEKTGMFYNCLRRNTDACIKMGRRDSMMLRVDNIECVFRDDSTLKTFRVNKSISTRDAWYSFYDTAVCINTIKHFSKEKQEFYRTPIMNEIADIVNSIK